MTDYEYEMVYEPASQEYELERIIVPRTRTETKCQCRCECIEFRARFVVTVKDKQVVGYSLKEWDVA
jgi:hypothetical protein